MSSAQSGSLQVRRRIVFILAACTSFFLYLHRYAWNLIRPELQNEYGFDNRTLEALGSLFYATYAIGSIPSGIVIDMFGPHLALTVMIVTWTVALPLHGLFGSVAGLGAVRLLFGLSQAGVYPALGQVTRCWFPLENRTRVQGWIASFFGRSGGAISSILMGTILMGWCGFSWEFALMLMSFPVLLFAIAFWFLFDDHPPGLESQSNPVEQGSSSTDSEAATPESRNTLSWRTALGNFSLKVMVVQQFMNAGADIVYTLVMGSFFVSLGIGNMHDLGWMVSLPMIGGACGGILGGNLNDALVARLGNRWGRTLVGATGKVLAAIALFAAISQPTAERVSIGLFFVKFFNDWTQPTVWGTITDLGGRYSATTFGVINAAGSAGALLMPLVFGGILDRYSTEQIVNGVTVIHTDFTPMFKLVGVFYVASSLSWLLVDCTKGLETTETK